MSERVKVINDVEVIDITPEFTPEERKERAKEVALGLLAFSKNRKRKDKTA